MVIGYWCFVAVLVSVFPRLLDIMNSDNMNSNPLNSLRKQNQCFVMAISKEPEIRRTLHMHRPKYVPGAWDDVHGGVVQDLLQMSPKLLDITKKGLAQGWLHQIWMVSVSKSSSLLKATVPHYIYAWNTSYCLWSLFSLIFYFFLTKARIVLCLFLDCGSFLGICHRSRQTGCSLNCWLSFHGHRRPIMAWWVSDDK